MSNDYENLGELIVPIMFMFVVLGVLFYNWPGAAESRRKTRVHACQQHGGAEVEFTCFKGSQRIDHFTGEVVK